MAPAGAAATMAVTAILLGGFGFARPYASRGEGGKFLVQLAGTATRTFCPGPVGRAHQDFAVLPALLAMKFVDWHEGKITGAREILKQHKPTELTGANGGNRGQAKAEGAKSERMVSGSHLKFEPPHVGCYEGVWPEPGIHPYSRRLSALSSVGRISG